MGYRGPFPGIFDPGTGRILGYFLKVIALLYLFGALVHLGNLAGFNEVNTAEAPFLWLILDVFYFILDVVVVLGLWQRTSWGVACLFLALVSQIILYMGFPQYFSQTPEQAQALRGMVGFHFSTVGIYILLRLINR